MDLPTHSDTEANPGVLTDNVATQCYLAANLGDPAPSVADQPTAVIPITALYPEILCKVFLHCAEDYVSRVGYEASPFSPYGWIGISHVCKHWRDVALSYPVIWSRITVTDQRAWIEELLGRSKGAPLYISVMRAGPVSSGPQPEDRLPNVTMARQTESLKLVLAHCVRIRALYAKPLYVNDAELIIGALRGQIPLLESVIIGTFNLESYPTDEVSLSSSQSHTRPATGKLLCLELPWFSRGGIGLMVASLTSLAVVRKVQSAPSLDMPEFLDALRGMALLENLVLESALAPLPPGHMHLHALFVPVHLPRLRAFRVVEERGEAGCYRLLHYLEAPMLSWIQVYTCIPTAAAASDLVPILKEKVADISSYATFSVGYRDYQRFGICAYKDDLSIVGSETAQKDSLNYLRPNMEIAIDSTFFTFTSILMTASESLPLENIRCLKVEDIFLPAETWVALVERTPDVTELHISGLGSATTCIVLLAELERLSHRLVVCPHPQLRSVVLDSVTFHDDLRKRLRDWLIERHDLGAIIDSLHILRCPGTTSADIKSLNEVVACVEWDGLK